MDEYIDDLDKQILLYLENDARASLKKLAEKLNKKTSTIYHRLQRMQNSGVIEGYSIIFNPEIFRIEKIGLLKIKLRPQKIKNFKKRFILSFSNFLKDEFPQIMFIATMDDIEHISCMVPFEDNDDYENFIKLLKENPYIENITTEFFQEIIKGKKIFNLNANLITKNKDKAKENMEFPSD